MEEVRGSSPLQPTIYLPSWEPLPELLRIACDHCETAEAVIDHLDLTRSEGQLQRLCRPCADAEKSRWDAERARGPLAGFGSRG